MEEEKKLVRVNLEDIGKKIGNRIDFYRFLREKCKRDSSRQHLLAQVRPLFCEVPQRHSHEEEKSKLSWVQYIFYKDANNFMNSYPAKLKVKTLYKEVLSKHPMFKDYFPDYADNFVPDQEFFWTMYISLFKTEAFAVLEKHAWESQGVINPDDTALMMDPFISEQLQGFINRPGKLRFK